MEKTREKSFLNIKSKLMAAVAMLLVAFFMVISSSYAWFTLSTAPEVTGIYTAVGANGNLEIALYTGNDNIGSNVGDTGKYDTWGNLIDLSQNDIYGLDKITLLPSAFQLLDGKAVSSSPLLTPDYGADGRVSKISANSIVGEYDGSVFKPIVAGATVTKGVKAIGTASSMTQQEIDYNNAITKLNAALALAQNYAGTSLSNSGSALANMAAKKGLENATTGYNVEFVVATGGMLDTLSLAADQLVIAMQNYYDAEVAVENKAAELATYQAAKYKWTGDDATDVKTLAAAEADTTTIKQFYNKYVAITTAIAAARTATTGVTLDNATWEQVTAIFITSNLVKIEDIRLNGYTMSEAKENASAIMSDLASGKGLQAQLPAGSGSYSDIAELCGNYSRSITVDINAGGLALDGMTARMITVVENAPTIKLADATEIVKPQFGAVAAADMSITTFYGYAIDLAFRTNAENSSLMLQTTPVNRIYAENGTQETMGHGSTMTFTATTTDFSDEQIQELMKAIRIVFTNKDTNEIIAVAILDADNAEKAEGITADLVLCEWEAKTISSGADTTLQTIELKAGENGGLATIAANDKGQTKLMDLAKNQQTEITAYVYIDGEEVDNTMVANGTSSMTGSLNLQFSSSATLVPMPYTPLQDQAASSSSSSSTPAQSGEGN